MNHDDTVNPMTWDEAWGKLDRIFEGLAEQGLYRLDLPDAVFAIDADWVMVWVTTATSRVFRAMYRIATNTMFGDEMFKRDWTQLSGEAGRSILNALRLLRNRRAFPAGTLTVYKEDDSTAAWTAAVTTTQGANPVTEVDPA